MSYHIDRMQVSLSFLDVHGTTLPFIVQLERPVLTWTAMPEYIRNYCERYAAVLEAWVCWEDDAATWKVFTEINIPQIGASFLIRAVRAQGEALVRVLCRALNDFYDGRPIALTANKSSDKPTHSMYLSVRLALRSALRRELQLRGLHELIESLDRDALAVPTPASLVFSDRLWDRARPPRFGPTAQVASAAQRNMHDDPHSIIDSSVGRAFIATRYREFADRVGRLLMPYRETPIICAVQLLARRAAEEASIATITHVTDQPSIWAIQNARGVLEQLLTEFIAIG